MLHRFVLLAMFIATGSGCVGHYLYESPGSVQTAAGQQTDALLYWYGDDGRLWYGKRYRQIDSDVSMIVCGTTPKLFDGGAEGEGLRLMSRSGDRLIRREDDSQRLLPVDDPSPLKPGSTCGRVSLTGVAVPSSGLLPGATPDIVVLCDNPRRPGRFPAVGIYRFESINRTKVKGQVEPRDICADPGGGPGSAENSPID